MLFDRLLINASTAPSATQGSIWVSGQKTNFTTGTGFYSSLLQMGIATTWIGAASEQDNCYYIKNDNTLWYSGTGQGGLSANQTGTPVQAGTDSDWVALACNWNCSIALKKNGTLWSWGDNSNGSTGQGTTTGTTTFATQIGSGTDWVKIGSNFFTMYAIKSNGTLWTWGSNTSYSTGLGTNTGTTNTPTQIGSATDWASLLLGGAYYSGYAIKTNGTLYSWGNGSSYQLGNGSTSNKTTPSQVGSATDWLAVNCSGDGTYNAMVGMRGSAGSNTLWTCGSNNYGLTGQGTTSGNTTAVTQIGTDTTWTKIQGNNLYVFCALKANGTLWTWGSNASGCTVQGTTTGNTTSPTQIGTANTWFLINAGVYSVTFLLTAPVPPPAGSLSTTGNNANYRTAQGTNSGFTQVITQSGSVTTWKDVQCSASCMIVLKTDGTLWSVGSNASGCTGQGTTTGDTSVLTQIGTDTDWAFISARAEVAVAIKTNGKMYSWGDNQNYTTAQNTNTGNITTPTQIGIDTDWAFVGIGSQNGAAIKTNGKLYSWGNNSVGQTGQNTTTGYTQVPTQVGTDTDWVRVSCAAFSMHIIKTNGTLWGCGYGPYAGFGTPTTSYLVPTQIGTDTNWAKIATGYQSIILLKTNGTIYSYGDNSSGCTGLGTSTGTTTSITQIGSATDWNDISIKGTAATSLQVFAIKAGGQLWSWGAGASYALGNNSTSDVLTPTQIGSDTNWKKISAGNVFSAALK